MTTAKYDYSLHTSQVFISPADAYGYWTYKDGSEGGGLWFKNKELTDYDGAFALPHVVCEQIRYLGYTVDDSCDASKP